MALFKPDRLHFLYQHQWDSEFLSHTVWLKNCKPRVFPAQIIIPRSQSRLLGMDSHRWKVTCLHELTGTNFLCLHCLHFPLTFGPVLCSSGETVTSVTSMSPLQPKKVKKKKEKEKLEQPPAIPAKGMRHRELSDPEHSHGGRAERGMSGMLHFVSPVSWSVLAPICGGGNALYLLPCLQL